MFGSKQVLFSDGMRRTDRRLRDLEEISSARLCVDGMAPEHGAAHETHARHAHRMTKIHAVLKQKSVVTHEIS